MKKAYIVLFTSLMAAATYGQSLQRTVINSTGGNIGTPGSIQMVVAIGEPIVGVSEKPEVALAQGFLGGSKSIVASPSGVQDVAADNATVYPNPFSSTVRIKSDLNNIHVSVYNEMGQEVYNGAYMQQGIDLSHLSTGIYMIHASADDKIISNTKLLKQ